MILRKSLIGLAIAAIAAIGAVGGVHYWRHDAQPRIDPDDKMQVAQGQGVYGAQCARCHGSNLEGQPNWQDRLANGRLPAPPHDDSGHTWHHPDEILFGIVKDGLVPPYAPAGYQSDMPAFRSMLGDDDIRAVLAFIESRWSPEVRKTRRQMLDQQGSGRR